jgi:hypothetical protein
MRLPSWLWPRANPCACEVERLKESIAETERAIEATQPILDEAKRRTDDQVNRLRAKTGQVTRRVAYQGALLKDLEEGWGRGHG